MDPEICLLLGQVSLNLLKRETSRRIYVVWVEIDETAADIQARSFTARALDKILKKCQAEGEAEMVK